MANANINVDLSQSIQNVEGLAKAVEKLAQSLGSVLQLSGQLQGSMSTIQEAAGAASSPAAAMAAAGSAPVAGSMFSKAGQAAGAVSDKYDAAQLALYKKTAEAMAAGHTNVSGGFHRGHEFNTGGTRVPQLMEASLFNKMKSDDQAGSLYSSIKATASGSGLVDPYGNPAKSALKDQVASTVSASERSSVYNPDSMYGIGITKADVGKAISAESTGEAAKGQERIASAIERLNQASKGADDSKVKALGDMVQLLQTVGDNMRDSSKELAEANKNVRETSRLPVDSPKRIAALNQQDIATGKVGSAYGMAGDLIQHAEGMAPPSGAPPSRWNRFGGMAGKAAGGLGGLIGLASAATIGYMGAEQVLDQATYGARLAGEQSKALYQQDLFKTSLEEADMTRAENVVKYRGNILNPDGNQRFTGTSGFGNAMKAATDMEIQSRGMEERERDMSLIGSKTQLGLGAGAVVGGAIALAATVASAPVTVPALALAAMAGGAYTMLSGAKGMAAGEFGSKYTALEGGLDKGAAGFIGGGMHGARWNELASDAKSAQEMLSRSKIIGNARALQEAETKQQQPFITAYQSIMDLEQAEKYGVTLAGPDAMTKEGVMAMYRAEADASGITATRGDARKWTDRAKKYDLAESIRLKRAGYKGDKGSSDLFDPAEEAKYNQDQSFIYSNQEIYKNVEKAARDAKSEELIKIFNKNRMAKTSRLKAYEIAKAEREKVDPTVEGLTKAGSIEYMRQMHEGIEGKKEINQAPTDAHFSNIINYVNHAKAGLRNGVAQAGMNQAAMTRMDRLPSAASALGIATFGDEQFKRILGGASAAGLDQAQKDNYIKAVRGMEGGEKAAEDMQKVFQQRELRPSVFAQLGISASEYMQRHAEITSTLGVSGAEGGRLTGRALTLSRSGMGSFQQMMGNLSQISAVSGGRGENLDKLEGVMSAAVAAGFDKSRLGQQFISTTTQIAEATKSRDVTGVAARFSMASKYFGVGDQDQKAGELAMRQAAMGIQSRNQWGAQNKGPVGAFKAMGLLGAGATFGTTFMSMMDMGPEQMTSMLRQIDTGKIEDPQLEGLIASETMKLTRAGMPMDKAKKQASDSIKAQLQGGGKGLRDLVATGVSNQTGVSVEKRKEGLLKAKAGEERQTALKAFFSESGTWAANFGGTREGGVMDAIDWIKNQPELQGVIKDVDMGRAKKDLRKRATGGSGIYKNTGEVAMQRYLDSLIINTGAASLGDPADRTQLETYFATEGHAGLVGKSGTSYASLGKTDKDKNDALKDLEGTITKDDLARAAQYSVGVQSKASKVEVINFSELTKVLTRGGLIKKPGTPP